MDHQSDERMNGQDILIFSADTHLVLIFERVADARSLQTIPAIQTGLTKTTLRKRVFITIPYQWDLFFCCLL
jgi:hypothetical protein